ncbi:MAG: DNA-processing protein DprA, partial [Puniceicoccales bacterium]|nr:DNA-processing protein DprA [Puniceicoccales bacterium]
PKVGPITYRKLCSHFSNDPALIFEATREELQKIPELSESTQDIILHHSCYFSLPEDWDKIQRQGISFLTDDGRNTYPPFLREIYDPPIGLYCKGHLPPTTSCIAIIGSRQATPYGLKTAHQLAYELAQRGYTIVSGMAQGIDAAAHEGALDAQGNTIAVFGTGVDVIYPHHHHKLYQRITQAPASCVLSEFPLGYQAERHHFPIRNRIISGLCQAVIVVETTRHGGSMITARMAAEQGRQVFAVPGRMDYPTSQGCLELIRDGATLLTKTEDIFEDLPFFQERHSQKEADALKEVDASIKSTKTYTEPPLETALEKDLYGFIHHHDKLTLEDIFKGLQHQPQQIISVLQMLELQQIVCKSPSGHYECFA